MLRKSCRLSHSISYSIGSQKQARPSSVLRHFSDKKDPPPDSAVQATDEPKPDKVAVPKDKYDIEYLRQDYPSPTERANTIIKNEFFRVNHLVEHFVTGVAKLCMKRDPVTGKTFKELDDLQKADQKPVKALETELRDRLKTKLEDFNSNITKPGDVSKDDLEIPRSKGIDVYKENPGWLIREDPSTYQGKMIRLTEPLTNQVNWPAECDVCIVGGGAIGSSIAYHLMTRARAGLKVVVIDKDMTYKAASTTLSVGGIRQQFSVPENILLSRYGMEFIRKIHKFLAIDGVPPPPINFNPHGYLTLADDEGFETLKDNLYIQENFEAKVKYMDRKALERKFPWMNFEGIVAGVMGTENEGWFDPWSLLTALRQKAIHLGVHYIEAEISGVDMKEYDGLMTIDLHPVSGLQRVDKVRVRMANGEERSIRCAYMVVAAGAQTGNICYDHMGMGKAEEGIMAYPVPIEPRKRYVYSFHAPKGPGLATPMVIDPSGTYFRREGFGNMYIAGRSPTEDQEPSVDNLEVDHDWFMEKVWPMLAQRVPAFNELKVQGSWAGFYEYNIFDQNGIIGPHPAVQNFIVASGFSGHGIQHSLGVGQAVSELIFDGDFYTLDLSRFAVERIMRNMPIYETGCV